LLHSLHHISILHAHRPVSICPIPEHACILYRSSDRSTSLMAYPTSLSTRSRSHRTGNLRLARWSQQPPYTRSLLCRSRPPWSSNPTPSLLPARNPFLHSKTPSYTARTAKEKPHLGRCQSTASSASQANQTLLRTATPIERTQRPISRQRKSRIAHPAHHVRSILRTPKNAR